MSIIKIARDCGWRNSEFISTCQDPCVVCLEGRCTVASEGCNHEFCTRCALYLCTINSSSAVAKGPPGSIPCPLCRHGIVSFIKLPGTRLVPKEISRTSLSLSFCGCSCDKTERTSLTMPLCKPPPVPSSSSSIRVSPLSSSFRSLSCQRFPSMKLNSGCCMSGSETSPSIIVGSVNRSLKNQLSRCGRVKLRRSSSHNEGRKSWFCSLNQYVATNS
ncbi:putative E3 ubiquitin-protein ligase XBOS32 [Bienertia sinuspersici]